MNDETLTRMRNWMFRSMQVEADSEELRLSGLRVGANQTELEQQWTDELLSAYPVKTRSKALKMARIYAVINCFENSVRDLVADRLADEFGVDWWEKGFPTKVRTKAEDRLQKFRENSWLEGEDAELITFADFGDLADVIIAKWDCFKDLIPSQHWVRQRFDELEQLRNFAAHNRYLLPSEFGRIEMYVQDWNRQVGA